LWWVSGAKAARKTPRDTFSGNLSIARAMFIPPKLCPTRTTVSVGGRDAKRSNKGLEYWEKVVFYFLCVYAWSCKVKDCDFVASWFQEWLELVPAPGTMAKTMHQDKVFFLSLILTHRVFLVLSSVFYDGYIEKQKWNKTRKFQGHFRYIFQENKILNHFFWLIFNLSVLSSLDYLF